jgi:hypothetical protein
MALELIGKLIKILPMQSGISARGSWSKQDFVIETLDQYPKKVCVSAWGERVNELSGANEGDVLRINFNVESREFNERWYTDVRAWRIEKQSTGVASGAATSSEPVNMPPPGNEVSFGSEQEVDDLPF